MSLGKLGKLLRGEVRQQQSQLFLLRLVQNLAQVKLRLCCAKNRLVEAQAFRALQVELEIGVKRQL